MSILFGKKSKLLILLSVFVILMGVIGCDTDDGGTDFTPGGDADSDTDTDTDTDTDADADNIDPDGDGIVDNPDAVTGACNNVLTAVVRDFKSSHADFEVTIVNDKWPDAVVQNWLSEDLGADGKPAWSNVGAKFQKTAGGETEWNENDANWIEMEFWTAQTGAPDPTPQQFHEWYNDVPGVNMSVTKGIILNPVGDISSIDNAAFFPLGLDEGFGAEAGQTDLPDGAGNQRNFLFTTEIHTAFEYEGGEVFSFRGDDDLWIFVNGKLAMDLGGLHQPANGTIDFDAEKDYLGIAVGNTYNLDIFHAERHTNSSNFKVETTIQCFVPIIE